MYAHLFLEGYELHLCLGKSPDLWCIAFSRLPSIKSLPVALWETAHQLQWPDRSGFSPDSFLIYTQQCRVKPKHVNIKLW